MSVCVSCLRRGDDTTCKSTCLYVSLATVSSLTILHSGGIRMLFGTNGRINMHKNNSNNLLESNKLSNSGHMVTVERVSKLLSSSTRTVAMH